MSGRPIVSIVSGILFGAGLALSGMMNPERVRGFLDVFGRWDPTLAFVMGGAVLVMSIAWPLAWKSIGKQNLPAAASRIDARLIGGAAIFGIGWGLGGLCPGPAIGSLATHFLPALVFIAAMFVGMALYRVAMERD